MSLRANKSFSHSVLVFVVVLLSPSSSCISICIIFQYAHQRIIHLFNFETVLVLCHHWHSLGILSVCRNCWCLSHFSFFPSFSSFSLPLALSLWLSPSCSSGIPFCLSTLLFYLVAHVIWIYPGLILRSVSFFVCHLYLLPACFNSPDQRRWLYWFFFVCPLPLYLFSLDT